jgi:hypothetical protein
LPRPPCGCSIDNRRHLCAGCWKPLTTTDLTYSCQFCDTGFQVEGFKARPCRTRYHVGCISVGPPFLTRLQARKGLFCPRDLARQRHFVCEACTVRAVRKEELGFFAWDFALLMLERMRMVDISNKWAASTLKTTNRSSMYFRNLTGSSIRRLFNLPVPLTLLVDLLFHLCGLKNGICCSLRIGDGRTLFANGTLLLGPVVGYAQLLRIFGFWTYCTRPENLTTGFKDRPTYVDRCSPPDELMYTYFTEGLRRRVGDHPNPSTVLQDHHIHWLNRYYQTLYQQASNQQQRSDAARAGVTHLMSYLGWLRAMETFGIRWSDVTIVRPEDGPTIGLPANLGAILLTLLEQTKSSQHAVVDVMIAFTTYSGLSLGNWFDLLIAGLSTGETNSDAFVWCKSNGSAWTSHLYRHKFLYPALYACQASAGDPFLRQFNGVDRPTIPAAFWSFNTQRRMGRSNVSKKRAFTSRAATPAEVVEHGRWHLSRSLLDMPLAYLEWSLEDRVCITYLCG